jgi:transposase
MPMLIDATALKHIFIVCGKTDLRKGIDGLAAFVIEEYDLDVYDQALFSLFCGTKKDRFKALY